MLGIIGLGGIYRDAYKDALAYLQKKDIIVFDINKNSSTYAVKHAKKNGLEYMIANSVREVFEEASEICLFLPPKEILPVIKEGVELANKNIVTKFIYIEKPLGVNYSESKEIKQILNAYGIKLYYNEVFLHSSTTDILVEEVLSMRNGKVTSIEMRFNGGLPSNITSQWRGDSNTGGMVWHDWGIHSIGLLLGILEKMSIDYSNILAKDMTVYNTQWEKIDNCDLLVQSGVDFHIEDIDISILASWVSKSDYEMRTYFENGNYLEVIIEKINGVSSWSLYEVILSGDRVFLGSSRYPKERFIRSLTAFLTLRNLEYIDSNIGIKSLEIIDELLEKAKLLKQ